MNRLKSRIGLTLTFSFSIFIINLITTFIVGVLIYFLFSIGVINTCTFMDMSDRKSLLLGVISESILYFIFLIIIGKKDNYKIPKNKNNIKRELLFQFILFTICLILNIITFIYYKV